MRHRLEDRLTIDSVCKNCRSPHWPGTLAAFKGCCSAECLAEMEAAKITIPHTESE